MPKLNTYVHAVERDQEGKLTGRAAVFGPDDELPDWAPNAIDNPDVWDGPAPERKPTPLVTVGQDDELARLRARVAELEAAKTSDADPNQVPTGSIPVILTWVGDDPARARRALDAENAAEKPRSTLVEQLEEIHARNQ